MEGSRKRKATNATPTSADGSASKKLRLLNSNPAPTTKSAVQVVGQKIVEQLKRTVDKSGRLIATEFLELPDRHDLPEYFDFIKLPVGIDTIEEKLKRDEYPTVTTLESDFKRLIQNAKDYNDPKSEIHEDAERIRKLVFNFMKQHNPAYKEDSKYSAFPTPIPKSGTPAQAGPILTNGKRGASEDKPSRQPSEKAKPAAPSVTSEQLDRKSSVAPSATTGDVDAGDGDEHEEELGAGLDFTGKTFQEAQQSIVSYLLRYTDEDGLEIYNPFGNLPTRKLEDYYKVIRYPVSLKSVAKRCRGQHGRAPPTGQTDFKSWDAFAEEMSFIWRNAKDYNEDGSEMYILAEEFEEHFKSLIADAKEKVDEPSTRIKIGAPKPKVMLNLSQHRASPVPAPGVTVDNESLARQKQMVQAGSSVQAAHRPSPVMNGVPRSTSQIPTLDPARPSSSARSGSPINGAIKFEKTSTQSPSLSNPLPNLQPLTNGMMPPPVMRPTSGSPFPLQPPMNSYYTPSFFPAVQVRDYPKEAALLPSIMINSHPQLKVSQPFSMSITPHATLSHQSTTTTLHSSLYFLQISATISKQLAMGRPYKLFVSVNGTRLTQKDTQLHAETNRRTHVYEGSLAQGVNRIEVEVAAAKEGDEKGLDVEKVTVFANLMR